jgi:hypothetical protein
MSDKHDVSSRHGIIHLLGLFALCSRSRKLQIGISKDGFRRILRQSFKRINYMCVTFIHTVNELMCCCFYNLFRD